MREFRLIIPLPIPGARSLLLALAAALAALLVVAAAEPRQAFALTNCTIDQSQINRDAEEIAFLALINAFRANPGQHGYGSYSPAGALSFSSGLDRPSAWHVNDMAAKKYFSHTEPAPSNRTFDRRITNCDYSWSTAGENIAAGNATDTAAEAFALWIKSTGHRDNMMNGAFTEIGIARYQGPCASSPPFNGQGTCWYWNTTFGKPTGSSGGGGSTDVLEFGATGYSASESSGGITATVIRSGNATGTVSVRCRPTQSGSSATAGTDYTSADVTVTLAPGEMQKTCRIPVTNDSDDEANETIRLTLTNVSQGAVIGSRSTTTLTINDDDETTYQPADANCDGTVNALDALLALRLLARTTTQPVGCGPFDPDGDGSITIADATLVRRIAAGIN